jgi:biotin carboxyl carrier protein
MAQEITAPLAGNIVQINIQPGEPVEEDAEALVIEAMKMETPIYAPCSGVVKDIKVSQGDKVEEDDVLAIIEEA